MNSREKRVENLLLILTDLICLAVSLFLAFWIRYKVLVGIQEHGDQAWQLVIALMVFMLVELTVDFDGHFLRKGKLDEVISVIKKEFLFSVVWILTLYLLHRSALLSRQVFGYAVVINTGLTWICRQGLKQYLIKIYKKSKYSSRMLLVTTSALAKETLANILPYHEWSYILTGLALLDSDRTEAVLGVPVVTNCEHFLDYVIRHDVDEVFIRDSDRRNMDRIRPWIRQLEDMGVLVNVDIDIFDEGGHGKKTLGRIGKYAVVTFARNLFSYREMFLKRMLDIAGSLVGMVILGVATIFVAPAIKLESPGPVFFCQTRVGKNGRHFTFYKFRSMYQDAEARKHQLMAQNEVKGLMFKMTNDPRITRVGKFIRRTSIDELPQFWNVLKGDMSLVGTRPPTVDEFEQYETRHKCRLSMTPGMTGLWQISGRSEIKDFDEVVKLDMQYIDNWTIWKDIGILLKTVECVMKRKGSQ